MSDRIPVLGSRWVWEIDKPHAICVLRVKEVNWNGEEWWVETESLTPHEIDQRGIANGKTWKPGELAWNELYRFWEAVTPIGGRLSDLTKISEVVR